MDLGTVEWLEVQDLFNITPIITQAAISTRQSLRAAIVVEMSPPVIDRLLVYPTELQESHHRLCITDK